MSKKDDMSNGYGIVSKNFFEASNGKLTFDIEATETKFSNEGLTVYWKTDEELWLGNIDKEMERRKMNDIDIWDDSYLFIIRETEMSLVESTLLFIKNMDWLTLEEFYYDEKWIYDNLDGADDPDGDICDAIDLSIIIETTRKEMERRCVDQED